MAGEGVNREVRLTIVVDGAEAAQKKIDEIIKNVNTTKMGEIDIPYKPPTSRTPKAPKEPKVGESSADTREISRNAKSVINDFKSIKNALNRALGKEEQESPAIRADETQSAWVKRLMKEAKEGMKPKKKQPVTEQEQFGNTLLGFKDANNFMSQHKDAIKNSLTRLQKLYPEFVTMQEKMNYEFSNTMSKSIGGTASVRNKTSDVKINANAYSGMEEFKNIIDHENIHALSIEKNIYNALKERLPGIATGDINRGMSTLDVIKEFVPTLGRHIEKTFEEMGERSKDTEYRNYYTVENTFKEVITELLTKLDTNVDKTMSNMREVTSGYLTGFDKKSDGELMSIIRNMGTIISAARRGLVSKNDGTERPSFNPQSNIADVNAQVAEGLKENLITLKDISNQLKDNAIKLKEQRLEAQRSLHGLKGVKGEDATEDRKELNETIYNINDALKENQIEQAKILVESSVLRERFKELSKSTKDVVEPEKNMRQQLTGMLIWMHTFRVFGEYSAVLKNQFTMLGNAVGMIMNQFLIPLYPILIGITVALYRIADAFRRFFKLIGDVPSLFLSLALVTLVLTKLFSSTTMSLLAFSKALDIATIKTAISGGGLKGGIMGFASANPVLIGVSLGLIGVYLLQITGVLKLANKAGQDFRKNYLNPWMNFVKSGLSILIATVALILSKLPTSVVPTGIGGIGGEGGWIDGLKDKLSKFGEWLSRIFEDIKRAFEEKVRPIWEALKRGWEEIKSIWEEKVKPIWDELKNKWEKLKNAYDTYLKPIFDAIKEFIDRIRGKEEKSEFKNAVDESLKQVKESAGEKGTPKSVLEGVGGKGVVGANAVGGAGMGGLAYVTSGNIPDKSAAGMGINVAVGAVAGGLISILPQILQRALGPAGLAIIISDMVGRTSGGMKEEGPFGMLGKRYSREEDVPMNLGNRPITINNTFHGITDTDQMVTKINQSVMTTLKNQTNTVSF